MADITVNAGGSVQSALNSAASGDRIICEKGATFTGPWTVPTKAGRVTLTSSSVLDGTLPNRRIATTDDAALATFTASTNSTSVFSGSNISNWTFQGLRFTPVPGLNNGVIDFLEEGCANNIFDRLLFEGSLGVQKRFLRADGANVLIKWLNVDDLHKPLEDGQGISIVRGSGPFTIYDCRINGGSECILFGGGSTSSAANNPQDIVIEHCDLSQPIGRYDSSNVGAATHLPKNLFELKNALRVKFRYNTLHDIEDSNQSGSAIMITPTNQDANSPWVRVYDVLIANCTIKHVARAVVITGYGYTGNGYTDATKHLYSTMQTDQITLRDLLVYTDSPLIDERFIQLSGEVGTVVVDNCTHINEDQEDGIALYLPTGATALRTGGASGASTYVVQNLTIRNTFMQGRTASDLAHGIAGNDRDDVVVNLTKSNNVVGLLTPGDWTTAYPGFTRENLTTYNANFANTTTYPLAGGSPHNNAGTDGTDIGWDQDDGAPVGGGGGASPIVWTSLTGTAVASGNDLDGGPSSGALSTVSITGDADIEWVMPSNATEAWVGLGTNAAYDLNGMSHAFEFGSVVGVRELGVYKTDWGAWSNGATFRINITGTTVKFYHNNVLKYTSSTPLTFPTKVDVGFLGAGGGLDDATITTAGVANVMPTVNAGPDRTILTGATATLSGTVVDDGQPSGTLTATWSKVLGPGTVSFGNANAAATTANVSVNGTYILRLTASDGSLSSYDDMMVMQTAPAAPTTRPVPRIFRGNTEVTTRIRA